MAGAKAHLILRRIICPAEAVPLLQSAVYRVFSGCLFAPFKVENFRVDDKTPSRRTGFLLLETRARPLGFGDFAGLDAACADADALGVAVDEGLDGLKIDVPAPLGDVVRVRDVVAELRAFAAN